LDADAEGHMGSQGPEQVMIPTPAQPTKRYGIGAVDYHTGETVLLIRRRKRRRREIAELLEALCWRSIRRGGSTWPGITQIPTRRRRRSRRSFAEQRVGWLCFTCPDLQPLAEPHRDALWRHFRREVSHCELFPTIKALVWAAYAFFERYNRRLREVLSIIGSDPAEIT